MSLLLKALQNAAKNREAGAVGTDGTTPAQAASEGAGELILEPIEKTTTDPIPRSESAVKSRTTGDAPGNGTDRAGAASRTQAQNVLRAGSVRDTTSNSSPGIMEWLARRPLVAFSTAAGLFAIGYGTYLYPQITNPGTFMARPAAPTPGPALTAPPPPPSAATPAPVPGPRAAAPTEPSQPLSPGVAPALPGSATDSRAGIAPAPAPAPSPAVAVQAKPPANPADTRPAATVGAPVSPAGSAAIVSGPSAPGPVAAVATPAAPSDTSASPPPRAPAPTARPSSPSRPRQAAVPAPAAAPVAPQSDLNNAYLSLQKGELNDAERLYRQVIAVDPRNIDAMLGLASVHAQQNRADAATQLYMRVLEVDPRNSYAQAGLLNIGGRADPAAAESRLKQLIARDPSAYLYFTLGNLYAEQNQWAGAQTAYFQAFNMAPDNPDYAFNLAVGLEHLSQPRLALDYYRRAVSIAQTRGNAQFALAPVQARIRSLETALAERP